MKKSIIMALLCVLLVSLSLVPSVMAGDGNGKAKIANEGTIELFQKNKVTGLPVLGGGQARLRYNLTGPAFNFVLNGKGLKPKTAYSLIYYAEEQLGVGNGVLLASSTSDSSGNLNIFGSRHLKYAIGVKICLVPSSDYDPVNKKFITLQTSNYLFGGNLVQYQYQAAAAATATEATKLVALFFDDGWQNQYDVALPILLQYNFKASFGLITQSIGTGDGFWKYYGVTEAKQLASYGMDIASHTRTHPDLTVLTSGELQGEVMGSKGDLEGLGFQIRTFIYPYFEYDDATIACVKEAGYICARAGGLGNPYYLTTTNPDEKYYIDCYGITNENLNDFKAFVGQASSEAVVCLCYHFISDTGPQETSTPVANFQEQMRYLKEAGFTVVLMPDLFQTQSPRIAHSPTGLTFLATQGGNEPPAQTLNILNSGISTLNWTAASNANWLALTPTSGSSTGDQNPVTVTATISGLSAGTYNGTITITATDATNSPQTVPVTLTVQAPLPTITVTSPNGGGSWVAGSAQKITWTYTGNPGSNVSIQLFKGGALSQTIIRSISVGSGGSGSYNWTIPAALTPGNDYTVKITSTTNAAYTDSSDSNFTITGPTITVTSPNGGGSWVAGSAQKITWTYTGNPGSNVSIQLFKGGALSQTIIRSISVGSGGSGSYNWTIPAALTPGNDYTVKITSTTNAAYTDSSDSNFTITGPTITVTSPNGGGSWVAGSAQKITWTYTGNPGSNVSIQLFKGGALSQTIIRSISVGSGGSGSYNWTIPAALTPGNDYTVKITSTTNAAYTDSSDSNFTITGPTITVTSPNGGGSWVAGSAQKITWTYTGNPGSNVSIQLFKGGALSQTIIRSISVGSGGSGSYNWTIPAALTPGNDYTVKITSTTNAAYTDSSDSNFTITKLP